MLCIFNNSINLSIALDHLATTLLCLIWLLGEPGGADASATWYPPFLAASATSTGDLASVWAFVLAWAYEERAGHPPRPAPCPSAASFPSPTAAPSPSPAVSLFLTAAPSAGTPPASDDLTTTAALSTPTATPLLSLPLTRRCRLSSRSTRSLRCHCTHRTRTHPGFSHSSLARVALDGRSVGPPVLSELRSGAGRD